MAICEECGGEYPPDGRKRFCSGRCRRQFKNSYRVNFTPEQLLDELRLMNEELGSAWESYEAPPKETMVRARRVIYSITKSSPSIEQVADLMATYPQILFAQLKEEGGE